MTSNKPYKGPNFYEAKDADLFFGRAPEAASLVSQILASRITVLHAPSGAGKTSILNSAIVPALESRGWMAFRVRPEDDPIEAVRVGTLRYVVPRPEVEIVAIRRLADELFDGQTAHSLCEVRRKYGDLPVRDLRRRSLLDNVLIANALHSDDARLVDPRWWRSGEYVPFISRWIQGRISTDMYFDLFGAADSSSTTSAEDLNEHSSLERILEFISEQNIRAACDAWVQELNVPVRDLSIFFSHTARSFHTRRLPCALVVVMDQFEELFTRFADSGVCSTRTDALAPDWRLRFEFFATLRKLYEAVDGNRAGPLELKFVISLRDEYLAQLDEIRAFSKETHLSFRHLPLLSVEEAKKAIAVPAQKFGYAYSAEVFAAILEQLTKEQRFVEPAHLQVVCDKLWHESGHALGEGGSISWDSFEALGQTQGIFKSFLEQFFNHLTEEEIVDAIEMMEPLVTSLGTRNIVHEEVLLNGPMRDRQSRSDLLKRLVDHTLLRIEERHKGRFVEVTHEFLLPIILEAVQARALNANFVRARRARETLARYEKLEIGNRPDELLRHEEFAAAHEARARMSWSERTSEVMLRSAIVLGAHREVLTEWIRRLEAFSLQLDPESILKRIASSPHARELSVREVETLNRHRESVAPTRDQIETIVKANLLRATHTDEENVRFWVSRLMHHGT